MNQNKIDATGCEFRYTKLVPELGKTDLISFDFCKINNKYCHNVIKGSEKMGCEFHSSLERGKK